MNDRPWIYFAHSLLIYGNDYEAYCLSLLAKTFANTDIFNPNGQVAQTTDKEAMKICLATVRSPMCKALCFATTSGMVGKGCMTEIRLALDRQLPVYCIMGNKVFLTSSISFTPIDFSNRVYAIANVACHCML